MVTGGGASDGILSERAGFEYQDVLRLFGLRIAVNLFLVGTGLFLITCYRMVHSLPSSFLFPIII